LFGKLFHSLELVDHILGEHSPIRAVYVSVDQSRKFGKFLSVTLESNYVHHELWSVSVTKSKSRRSLASI